MVALSDAWQKARRSSALRAPHRIMTIRKVTGRYVQGRQQKKSDGEANGCHPQQVRFRLQSSACVVRRSV